MCVREILRQGEEDEGEGASLHHGGGVVNQRVTELIINGFEKPVVVDRPWEALFLRKPDNGGRNLDICLLPVQIPPLNGRLKPWPGYGLNRGERKCLCLFS